MNLLSLHHLYIYHTFIDTFKLLKYRIPMSLGWALLGVKIETSMNRLATFHKVGPGRGEHDGEKSFWIGSLICPTVRARSYA